MTAFEEFGVMPEIGRAVDEMDWTLPTDVQVSNFGLDTGVYIAYKLLRSWEKRGLEMAVGEENKMKNISSNQVIRLN